MNELALLAIGFGLGLSICLVAVMVAVLYRISTTQRIAVTKALSEVTSALSVQAAAVAAVQSAVTLALSQIDADRLYAASLSIQKDSRVLAVQVDTLGRALFAQPGQLSPLSPALDLAYGGLDDEAAADQPLPAPDPLAGLPLEERERRVAAFFARRRAGAVGQPGSGNLSDIHPPGLGGPPAFGSGAYAALAEQAAAMQQQAQAVPPADFSSADEAESEVELAENGELE